MYYLIIDTCVWIELCKRFPEVRKKVSGLVEQQKARLILPQIVINEWNKHKHSKIIGGAKESIAGKIKNAKQLAQYLEEGDANKLRSIIKGIHPEEIAKVLMSSELNAVDALFLHPSTIMLAITDQIKAQAADRALTKKAPFHNNRNNMADALILLSSVEYVAQNKLSNAIFVSSNTSDFSMSKDKDRIHENIQEEFFDDHGIKFFANIGQAVNEIEEDLVNPDQVQQIDRNIVLGTAMQNVLRDYRENLKNNTDIIALQEALKLDSVVNQITFMNSAFQAVDTAARIAILNEVLEKPFRDLNEIVDALRSSIRASEMAAIQEAVDSLRAIPSMTDMVDLDGYNQLLGGVTRQSVQTEISEVYETDTTTQKDVQGINIAEYKAEEE